MRQDGPPCPIASAFTWRHPRTLGENDDIMPLLQVFFSLCNHLAHSRPARFPVNAYRLKRHQRPAEKRHPKQLPF